MNIETGLILGLMVGYGILYSLKRIFNIIDFKIRHKEIPQIIVSGTREEKNKSNYKDDLDKTLELSEMWK